MTCECPKAGSGWAAQCRGRQRGLHTFKSWDLESRHPTHDLCACECHAIVDPIERYLFVIEDLHAGVTKGPWQATQMKIFGANRFIQQEGTGKVVAHLIDPGNMYGDEFIAASVTIMPQLIREIRHLVSSLREAGIEFTTTLPEVK